MAEIGTCYLESHAGILDKQLEHNASYIQGWLHRLRNDKRFIFSASSQAQKSTDYILNLQQEENEVNPDENGKDTGGGEL